MIKWRRSIKVVFIILKVYSVGLVTSKNDQERNVRLQLILWGYFGCLYGKYSCDLLRDFLTHYVNTPNSHDIC